MERRDQVQLQSLDKFRIDSHIKSGGFGAVYRASSVDDIHNVRFAIKEQMITKDDKQKELLFRIQKEIATCQLKHPNIVDVYEYFFTENGNFDIISELGKTDLQNFIKKRF